MNARLEEVRQGPRSVSQYQQYAKCPYSYYLQRVKGAWQRPAAWLVQGLAVHEAVERFERSERGMTLAETVESYEEAYERHANALLEDTPNMGTWFYSGPYDGETDLARRFTIGREQIEDYVRWALEHPEEKVWQTPDGDPAIELEFDTEIGGVRVRGFIDQVTDRVRDIKSGNEPGDDFQLAVYAVALEKMYGKRFELGDYWMGAKKGRHRGPTHPYRLDVFNEEHVAAEFRWLDEQIKAEAWEPKPDPDTCRFCSVQSSCAFRM